ncbi:VWA-like domain-containing protein [Rubripirellula amarantea]|nr:VWA-like domain-containing protein [Rubripirellula amarantea]
MESVSNDQPKSKHDHRTSAKARISRVVESWFLTEPMLFAAWTTHHVVTEPRVKTIRVGRGKVEYNSAFIESLKSNELKEVLAFEAMRILLGHPYARRQPNAELTYAASNLTVQEYLRTKLPIPRPRDLFDSDQFDSQYFEYYYRELSERATGTSDESPNKQPDAEDAEDAGGGADNDAKHEDTSQSDASNEEPNNEPEQNGADQGDDAPGDSDVGDSEASDKNPKHDDTSETGQGSSNSDLQAYADPMSVGIENTSQWDEDELFHDEIHALIREASEHDGWGTLSLSAREQLQATLNPVLDYRAVLRSFRQSVMSVNRRLTRMKPSRRYGFDQLGSRYDFTTKLLFAVDVSGSMGSQDLSLGFSVVSRFFRYGVESVDVIWFDSEIRGGPLTLRRARHSFEISGRGGTNFQPLMAYLDQHRQYDGLIVFTDGQAPVPRKPINSRTQVLWLLKDRSSYQSLSSGLSKIGRSACLRM